MVCRRCYPQHLHSCKGEALNRGHASSLCIVLMHFHASKSKTHYRLQGSRTTWLVVQSSTLHSSHSQPGQLINSQLETFLTKSVPIYFGRHAAAFHLRIFVVKSGDKTGTFVPPARHSECTHMHHTNPPGPLSIIPRVITCNYNNAQKLYKRPQ